MTDGQLAVDARPAADAVVAVAPLAPVPDDDREQRRTLLRELVLRALI